MASPRKFSEKIALHNQKQAETDAAFEAIMREVGVVKTLPESRTDRLSIVPQLGAYRGGSLPNVNQISSASCPIDLQAALSSLEGMKQNIRLSKFAKSASRPILRDRKDRRYDVHQSSPYSPYDTGPYLSPPSDTNWRRVNSDSAIHSSLSSPRTVLLSQLHHRQDLQTRMNHSLSRLPAKSAESPESPPAVANGHHRDGVVQPRPRSCEAQSRDVSTGPLAAAAAEACPSSSEAAAGRSVLLQHSCTCNSGSGSLPDLTNLNFASPLANPLDAEEPPPQATPDHANVANALRQRVRRSNPILINAHQAACYCLSQTQLPPPLPPPPPPPSFSRTFHQAKYRRRIASELAMRNHSADLSPSPTSPVAHPMLSPADSPSNSPTFESYRHLQRQFEHFKVDSSHLNSIPNSFSPSSVPLLSPEVARLESLGASSMDSTSGYGLSSFPMHRHSHQVEQPTVFVTQSGSSNSAFCQSPLVKSVSSEAIFCSAPTSPVMTIHSVPANQLSFHSSSHSHQGSPQTTSASPTSPGFSSPIPDIVLTGAAEDPNKFDEDKELNSMFMNDIGDFAADFLVQELRATMDPIDLDGLLMLTDPSLIADPAVEDFLRCNP